MKKRIAVIFLAFIIFIFATVIRAGDYKDTYVRLLKAGKYDELLKHLTEWEQVDPDNPELYIAYFSYYYNLSREEKLMLLSPGQIDQIKQKERVFTLTDPEDPERVVGYLYSEIVFDEEKMDLGLKYLDEGLKRHPARLDMHLGKLHALDKISRYEAGKEALLEMLNLSVELDNRWLYQDGVPLEDGYAFMLENIQGWINHYFNLEEERVHDYIIEICQRMIQLYPDCVYAYNNLGAICYYKNDYPEALAYFRQAAACNPEDTIVIKNIAHLARTIGDRELALEYYGKLMEYGNEEEKEMAAEQIKLLEEANE